MRCNEVTRLCASDAVRTAPLRTRIALRLHLMMCRSCRRYVHELRTIGRAVRSLGRDATAGEERQEEIVRRVLSEGKREQD